MNENHKNTKKVLRILGISLLCVGIICVLAGGIDFSLSIISMSGMPKLFGLLFLGFPCVAIGVILIIFSSIREVGTYVKNESVPLINETTQEIKPAIKHVVSAVKDGLKGESNSKVCSCGCVNESSSKFCKSCGKSLIKTCSNCGTSNSIDSIYCSNCGEKLN